MTRIAPPLLVACLLTAALTARQTVPSFEVASVKPNTTDAEPSMLVPPRGLVTIVNVPLQNVIVNAFGVPPFRVVDAPEWIRRERFDINARIPDNAAPGQTLVMLQALLADRFKLRTHRETRNEPTYQLVIARTDGRVGPGLKASAVDCSTAPPTFSPDSPCRGVLGVGPAGGTILARGQPVARLVSALSMAVNRTVVDQTNLKGAFDVELRWGNDVTTNSTGNETPAIFTALQQQLGLRLESSRGAVDVLVIDAVDRPRPD
jgi:uncharacterized protein (TIGR03435 family)